MFNMKKVMWCVVKVIAASPQAAHYSWRSSVLTRAQSFFRAMYSWQDLDFCICLSALLHPYMSSKVTQVRMFHYQKVKHWVSKAASKFFLDLDRKFTVTKNNTSCLYFLVEVFIKVMKVSVASLEESSALSWVYQCC